MATTKCIIYFHSCVVLWYEFSCYYRCWYHIFGVYFDFIVFFLCYFYHLYAFIVLETQRHLCVAAKFTDSTNGNCSMFSWYARIFIGSGSMSKNASTLSKSCRNNNTMKLHFGYQNIRTTANEKTKKKSNKNIERRLRFIRWIHPLRFVIMKREMQ